MAEPRKPQDDEIIAKLDQILANQEKFAEALAGNGPVIPELEGAIRMTALLTRRIDRKVPDKQLNPLEK